MERGDIIMTDLTNPIAQTWLAKLQRPDSSEGAKVTLPETTQLLTNTLTEDADGCTYQEYVAAGELIDYLATVEQQPTNFLWRPQGEKFASALHATFGVDALQEKLAEAPATIDMFKGLTALPLTGNIPGVLLVKGQYAIRVEARPIANGIEFTIIPFFNQRLTKFDADTLQRLHAELGLFIANQLKRSVDPKFVAMLQSVRRAISNAMPPPALWKIALELRGYLIPARLQELVEAFDRVTEPEAIPALEKILEDRVIPAVARAAAAKALGRIAHSDVIGPLEWALRMQQPIRQEAILGMSQCTRIQQQRGEIACLVAIITLFEKDFFQFTEEVLPLIEVLGESNNIAAVPTLQRAADESINQKIRAIARTALDKLLK